MAVGLQPDGERVRDRACPSPNVPRIEPSDLVHIWRRFDPECSFLQDAAAAELSHSGTVARTE